MDKPEIIAIVTIALIITGAVIYIVNAKKSGRKCIGCPEGCSCSARNKKGGAEGGSCGSCCGCQSFEE